MDLCARSRALEQRGEYEDARNLLSDLWDRVGERPKIEGLNELESAMVQLRVGYLTGWLGSTRKIEGAQERSLDLLSECSGMFERLGDVDGYAEAQLGIALAYWRKASFDEARVILDGVLGASNLGKENRLSAIIIRTIVERSDNQVFKALSLHESAAALFEAKDVPARLKATFFHGWALTHRQAGNIDEALLKYSVTTKYLEEAGDNARLAIVEGNYGFLFYSVKAYSEALEHIQRALSLYRAASDLRGAAQVGETLSRVLIEVGDYEGAERAARAAVEILRGVEEKAQFVEGLTSLGTALARQGRRRESYAAFSEAEEEALNFVGQSAAAVVVKKIIEELGAPACLDAGISLEEPVNLLEKAIVRGALQRSNKSMREAAMRLGVEYNTLRYIVNNRHPELREERTRVYVRPNRAIIKRDSSKVTRIREDRKKS